MVYPGSGAVLTGAGAGAGVGAGMSVGVGAGADVGVGVTPLSYPGVALTLCCLLIVLLPYLYDRTACFCLLDLSWI